MRDLFLAAKLPGVAALIEDAARNSVTEFRPSFIDDQKGLLLRVSSAVADFYGSKLMSADEIAEDIKVSGAEAKSIFLGTGLIIGPIATGPGKRIEITALQWLETLSMVMKDVAPEAIAAFDSVCASMARATDDS